MTTTPATSALPASTQRFSTEGFDPRERVAAWSETYGHSIAKLRFAPVPEASFAVDATMRTLPELGIVSMSTHGLSFTKSRDLIDADDLILVIVEHGGYHGSQLGRDVTLGPGDAVVRRNAEITTGTIFGRLCILRVPTHAISRRVGDVSAAIHRRIPVSTTLLPLLRSYVRAVHESAATSDAQRIATAHVHDLVGLLLGGERKAGEEAGGGRALVARLHAIKEDIARNLQHGDVSLEAIAGRHRVSPRYLQKLFDADGTTFSEYLLRQRLACAHRLLSDPRQQNEKIASIAFAAGFGDVSYFYRVFRRQFGATPADVRALAQRVN